MDIRSAQEELVDVTCRLVRELGDVLPAGSIVTCVTRCRDELMRMGVRQGLAPAVEAMARRRLRGQLMTQCVPMQEPVGV